MTNIKIALSWLYHNGREEEVERFFEALKTFNMYSAKISFKKDPECWTGILKKICLRLYNVDRIYFQDTGEHFLRIFNTKNKADMLNFITDILKALSV